MTLIIVGKDKPVEKDMLGNFMMYTKRPPRFLETRTIIGYVEKKK